MRDRDNTINLGLLLPSSKVLLDSFREESGFVVMPHVPISHNGPEVSAFRWELSSAVTSGGSRSLLKGFREAMSC